MLDTHPTLTPPTMQRVRGRAAVSFGARGLEGLHQSGSAKAMLPRVHGCAPEVVFLNTAGGLTGGDRLDFELSVAAGGRVVGTTQTAERAYAATQAAEAAQVAVTLTAGQGAHLDWLPQETILFENSHVSRRTRADLAHGTRFLFVETLVFGRAAMGEVLGHARLSDRREVRRSRRLEYLDPLMVDADILATPTDPVTLGGARALTTLGLFAQGAEDAAERLKSLNVDGVRAGVSGWDGKLIIRALAADGMPLRRYISAALTLLRDAPLPRVWQL